MANTIITHDSPESQVPPDSTGPNFPYPLNQIIYPLRFAAGEIARVSGPNWTGWLVLLLQECERLTAPEHFAGILKSLRAHIDNRLETGGWL